MSILSGVGILGIALIVLLVPFIIQIAVLAFAISKIYKTGFSLLKAFLVLLLQFVILILIAVVIFFALGGFAGLLSLIIK